MPEPREVITAWYEGLKAADLESFAALHADDVIYNITGRTEISGRWQGKEVMFGEVIPKVFAALDPETLSFAQPFRIFAVDGEHVAGMMFGGGKLPTGEEYEQVYAHMFHVRDGLIREVWEFFDTELAQARLFGKDTNPAPPPAAAMEI